MTNRSFIRFGGVAGILLAATSWLAFIAYWILVPTAQKLPVGDVNVYLGSLAQDPFGTLVYNTLSALIAFWAVIGIIAMYFRLREIEAWAFFSALIGVVAAIGTLVSSLYLVAQLRYAAALLPFSEELAINAYNNASPINPYGIMTFGLTAVWFLVTALLMLRQEFPRPLAYLGIVSFADLSMGFFASFAVMRDLATYASFFASAVCAPLFWLWLGILLSREQLMQLQSSARTMPAS